MGGGRQREFSKQVALEKAMFIFWKKGFVGASLTELTQAMGINKPSMYAAFGNKEQLFIQATENYIENYAMSHVKFLYLDGQSFASRLKSYLMSVLASQCDEKGPRGCYISLCVTEAASEDLPKDASEVIKKSRDLSENLLTEFLIAEQAKKNISKQSNPKELARFLVTILHGTAAMARGFKTVDDMEPVIDRALMSII